MLPFLFFSSHVHRTSFVQFVQCDQLKKKVCVRLQTRETERERERKKEETVFFVNDVTFCKRKKGNRTPFRICSTDQSYIFPCVDQSRSFIIYTHTILVIIVGQRYSKKIVTPARKEDLTFRLRHFDPLDLRLAA